MHRAWYVGRFPEQITLAVARGGPLTMGPQAAPNPGRLRSPSRLDPKIAPEAAAFRVQDWFPDDARGRAMLHEVLVELGESRVQGPIAEMDLARARVREALRHGVLTAHAVEEKLSGTPIERPIEVRTRQEDEKHFVEFIFTYPDGSPVKGVEYELVLPTGQRESGKLGGDGTITKDDCEKGSYVVIMKDVESVRWARSRARCDDEVKIYASVSGFPPGAAAKIKVYREHKEQPGDEVATLDAGVKDDKIEATFKYDYKKDDATKREEGIARFIAEVSLEGGKYWAKTPSALEIELKTIRFAKWSADYAQDGDTVDIGVDVLGFADGTPAKLSVHRFHLTGGADDEVKSFDLKIKGNRALGACAYTVDGKGDIVKSGEYYFEVTIDDGVERKARSALLWCTDAV